VAVDVGAGIMHMEEGTGTPIQGNWIMGDMVGSYGVWEECHERVKLNLAETSTDVTQV